MSTSQWRYTPLGSHKAMWEGLPSRSPPEVSFACERMPSCGNTRQLTRWRSSSLSTACQAMRTSARRRLCIRVLLPCIPDMHAACPHEAMMKPQHKTKAEIIPRLPETLPRGTSHILSKLITSKPSASPYKQRAVWRSAGAYKPGVA